MMLAHYHGQQFNASELGKSLGVADTTVSRYLDILTGTFMVRRLTPWFENIKKRQIKTPKIYVRDSGVLHRLLGIPAMEQMVTHPRLGASWEGFALEQVIGASGASEEEVYFWGVHNQGRTGPAHPPKWQTTGLRNQVHRRPEGVLVSTRRPGSPAPRFARHRLSRRRELSIGRRNPSPGARSSPVDRRPIRTIGDSRKPVLPVRSSSTGAAARW
jgi:hypothetical protein